MAWCEIGERVVDRLARGTHKLGEFLLLQTVVDK